MYSKFCRICVEPNTDLISVFDNDISDKIMACAPVQVCIEDGFPPTICKPCNINLNVAYDIHKQILKSYELLKKLCVKDHGNKLFKAFSEICVESEVNTGDNSWSKDSNDSNSECFIENTGSGRNSEQKRNIKMKTAKNKIPKPINAYPCEICLKTFTSYTIRDNHLSTEHRDQRLYKCIKCDKSYLTLNYLKLHSDSHIIENESLCNVCGKVFKCERYLKGHMKFHRGDRPFKCDQCVKAFKTSGNLRVHKHTHSNARILCEECNKTFKTRDTYLLHNRKVHTDKYKGKYVCSHCGKNYDSLFNLKNHLRRHTGEQPFKCDFCYKTFTWKTSLKQHLLIHTKEKPHSCPYCDDKFRHLFSKNYHIKHFHKDIT